MPPTIAGRCSIRCSTAHKGYAWSLSSFTSKIPQFKGRHVVIDGISRFIVRDGLIAEYRESVNGGVAMAQLGVAPDRMTKVFTRWTGWLRERPETVEYLARPKGSRKPDAMRSNDIARRQRPQGDRSDLSAYSL